MLIKIGMRNEKRDQMLQSKGLSFPKKKKTILINTICTCLDLRRQTYELHFCQQQ